MIKLQINCLVLVAALACIPAISTAADFVKFNINRGDKDPRQIYNYQVLETALKISEQAFGGYQLLGLNLQIPTARLLNEVVKGDLVNVAISVTRPNWESSTLAIKIPIRRGILSYRLLLINQKNKDKFKSLTDLNQLKNSWACLGRFWSTTQAMEALEFKSIKVKWDKEVITMLNRNRCEYMPRGVHEIFEEMDHYQASLKNLMIEDKLALYIPAAFYVFVSPNAPQIHKRIQFGLEQMVEQGILKQMVEQNYRKYLDLADLKNRKIFYLGNPTLAEDTPFDRKELWLRWDLSADK